MGIYLQHAYNDVLEVKLTGKISDSDDVKNFITLDKIHAFMQREYPDIKFKTEKELLDLVKNRKFLMKMLRSFTIK